MMRLFLLFVLLPALAGAEPLSGIENAVDKEIAVGRIPGAVIEVGNREGVLYRRAFGMRAAHVPMTEDTIFDLASVTKAVATTTALMQLAAAGKIDLDRSAAFYWPEFGAMGKDKITVRELLTHTSGLRADLDLRRSWSGYQSALDLIVAERPLFPPGSRRLYSDINFEVLGELVRRISGESLAAYCAKNIFLPLGMKDTGFLPAPSARIAPTSSARRPGEVHDPTAFRMGGVSGHAGLFSTAADLGVFARALLAREKPLMGQDAEEFAAQGLGWQQGPPLVAGREALSAHGSFGHLGYTGTMLWLDPAAGLYVVALSNRVYSGAKGDATPMRHAVLDIVGEAMGGVRTGIDVLEAQDFAPLRNLRIGLITNRSGVDFRGRRSSEVLARSGSVKLAAIFAPEHGVDGAKDEKFSSAFDPHLHVPVYSLYGKNLRPTPKMLAGIDALVFDLQDAGARFYTYATTLAYAMQAAAQKGIPFYVLDRPNPISAAIVEGPVLDPALESFTGFFPLPVRHGMTIGELAQLFDRERKIGADLHVVAMQGYRRNDWFDDTRLPWVNPSPNLRSLAEAALYPGVALVEGADVSVGRGTASPFEVIGAPWIDAEAFSSYLAGRNIPGVKFSPVSFTPDASPYRQRECRGIRITLTDRARLDSPRLGVELSSALEKLYPERFEGKDILPMVGSHETLDRILAGEDPKTIVENWQAPLAHFTQLRAKYLLY